MGVIATIAVKDRQVKWISDMGWVWQAEETSSRVAVTQQQPTVTIQEYKNVNCYSI